MVMYLQKTEIVQVPECIFADACDPVCVEQSEIGKYIHVVLLANLKLNGMSSLTCYFSYSNYFTDFNWNRAQTKKVME